MCGILFTSQLTRTTRRILPHLAVAMETRGADSWGYTDGATVTKFDNQITKNFHIPRGWDNRPFICHTRAASVGDVTVENAHPFDFTDKRRVVGIHNGGVRNWQALNNKYDRKFDVDSMHIFKHLAEEREVDDLHMMGVIVWMENADGIVRYARSTSNSLAIAQLTTGEVIGCSEGPPLAAAMRMARAELKTFWKVDSDLEYKIERNVVYHDRPLPFWTTKQYVPSNNVGQQGSLQGINFGRRSYTPPKGENEFNRSRGKNYTNCAFCGNVLDTKATELVSCWDCIEKFAEGMDKVYRVDAAVEARLAATQKLDEDSNLPPAMTELERIGSHIHSQAELGGDIGYHGEW